MITEIYHAFIPDAKVTDQEKPALLQRTALEEGFIFHREREPDVPENSQRPGR